LYANAEIVQHVFAKIFHPCKNFFRAARFLARVNARLRAAKLNFGALAR
jgi:hypothetical protein